MSFSEVLHCVFPAICSYLTSEAHPTSWKTLEKKGHIIQLSLLYPLVNLSLNSGHNFKNNP